MMSQILKMLSLTGYRFVSGISDLDGRSFKSLKNAGICVAGYSYRNSLPKSSRYYVPVTNKNNQRGNEILTNMQKRLIQLVKFPNRKIAKTIYFEIAMYLICIALGTAFLMRLLNCRGENILPIKRAGYL